MTIIVRKLPMRAGWRDAPLALQDLAEAICIKRGITLRVELD